MHAYAETYLMDAMETLGEMTDYASKPLASISGASGRFLP